jgi:hypothetical protein
MTPEEKFWKWFERNEEELLHFEVDQERIFDRLASELQKIDPELTFEFGPLGTIREFVISAAGVKDSFPSVVSLKNSAPVLSRWRITAFRPRRSPLNTIEFRGKCVDPLEVEFILLDNGKIPGLYLFIPGMKNNEETDYKVIGYLLLDEALGEYDVETGLGFIEMCPFDTHQEGKRYPLEDLPFLFDKLTSQLQGRPQLPS